MKHTNSKRMFYALCAFALMLTACSTLGEGVRAVAKNETLYYVSQALRDDTGALSLVLSDFAYLMDGAVDPVPVEERVCLSVLDNTREIGNVTMMCVEPGGKLTIPVIPAEGKPPNIEVVDALVADRDYYICNRKFTTGIGGAAFTFHGNEGKLDGNFCVLGKPQNRFGDEYSLGQNDPERSLYAHRYGLRI